MAEVKKIPLVLFSGGLDSTFMLWRYLQKSAVDVLYINGGQGDMKMHKENTARSDILNALLSHDPVRTPHKVDKKLQPRNTVNFGSSTMQFKQTPAWLMGALEVVDPSRHSCVAIGNVMGDEMWGWSENIIGAWDHLCQLSHDVKVPLEFPLKCWSKFRILKHLPPSLYKNIWYCEMPKMVDKEDLDGLKKIVPCGSCGACVTHQVELYRFKIRTKLDHETWLAQGFYVDSNDEDFNGITIRNKSERHESQGVSVHETQ